MKYVLAGSALLFVGVLATPAPLNHLFVRDPDTTNNLPDGDKNCNGNKYSPSDIKTAVNFAWQAKKDGKQYSMFSLFKNPISLCGLHYHACGTVY